MRAEDTLQFMADFYPSLFPTRKHCLDYLFCLIGNGYKWIEGELVDQDSIYEKRYKLVKPVKHAEFINEQEWWNRHNIEKEISKTFNKPMLPDYQFSWSELSKKYSYIYNYPDNIKSDWLQLLEETRDLLIKDNIDI